MFKFFVISLSFKPALTKKRIFFLSFEVIKIIVNPFFQLSGENKNKITSTEENEYNLTSQSCHFSEILKFDFNELKKNPFISLKIYEKEPLLKKNQLIADRIVELSKETINEIVNFFTSKFMLYVLKLNNENKFKNN